MKKTIISITALIGFCANAAFVVKIDSDTNVEFISTEEDFGMTGYLIDFRSINNSSIRNEHDVTKTSEPTWDKYFGQTKDYVLNEVSSYNVPIQKTGTVNWFDPDRTYLFSIGEACTTNDTAHINMEFIDNNSNTLFWLRSRSNDNENYGSKILYGKESDISDIHLAPTLPESYYPIFYGFITFDTSSNTVNFKNLIKNSTNKFEDFSLSGVNVSDISKIRVSYSHVMSTYSSGTTCGTDFSLYLPTKEELDDLQASF